MPKKNKKPGRNGFWEFALELRDKNPNKQMTADELQTYASRKWTAMSKAEKEPYEQRAHLARNSYNPSRLTTDGLEIDEVERQQRQEEERIRDMKSDIMKKLKSASFEQKLDEEVFLLIHINHLVHVAVQDKVYICEVAIAAFSLKDGLLDVFHAIVKPGRLPLGYSGTAIAHSKETHQLYDLVMREPVDNTPEVYKNMTEFIRKYSREGEEIVYSAEPTFEMITKVMDGFQEEFNSNKPIKVYSLQYMFFALRNTVAERPVWTTESFSFHALDRDLYCYSSNIACEYHELADITLNCSKSIVTRNVYTICDNCCADLKIDLIAGFHVPAQSKIAPKAPSRLASHATSVASNEEYSRAYSRTETSFSSGAAYDNNYPPLSSARSAGSSVRSFSSIAAGPSATTALRLEQSFKALTVKEVDKTKRHHMDYKFPEHGPKKQ